MRMALIEQLGLLTKAQRNSIVASYLGWTLDAFDFFLMMFMIDAISKEFGVSVKDVTEASFFTLAARPFGAFVFGWIADRVGRRPVMMLVILLFSGFSVLSGFAQTLAQLWLIRALFGFAMGGEWGIGASLVMETIPPKLRGLVSGLLQSGYPSGYFVASLASFLLFDHIGWRGMFFVGVAPALLVFLIRMHVEESPAYEARRNRERPNPLAELARHWKIALYLVVLMTAFNFFSHGTQDLYPTFLQKQHGFDTAMTSGIALIMNAGAIVGGLSFGIFSERIGRKRAVMIACALALPVIPLWAFSETPVLLALGAFSIQVCVQGAWGVVPAHLNELSPALVRGMFPGFAYQLGNLIASRNGPLQAWIAEDLGKGFGFALASVTGVTVIALFVWIAIGPERRDVDFLEEAKAQ
jgi:SHS family lactate transporter-like MFS transporter